MKFRYTLLAVAIAWAISGCNTSNDGRQADRIVNDPISDRELLKPALELAYAVAYVEVMPYDVVHLQPQDLYDVDLRVSYDDGIPHERTLRLAKSEGPDGTGIEVSLFDETGDMLITIAQRWMLAPDNSVQYTLDESTPYDALSATMSVDGADVSEVYNINGAGIALEYVDGTASEDAAIATFAEFYAGAPWTESRTLDNNAEGEMMMMLVNDTAFVNWAVESIVPAYDRGSMEKVACDALCHVCGLAGGCSMLKCTFGGGIANPICVACFGVSAACFITYAVSNLFGI